MPELPEVETLKLGIKKYVVGHKILDIEISKPKMFSGDKEAVIGAKITGVRRIGKGLILELSNGFVLAIHIKMTGQLVFRDEKTKDIPLSIKVGSSLPAKYTHIIFKLDKGATLYFNDMRRFGWVKILPKDEAGNLPFFRDMGPEPLAALGIESTEPKSRELTFERFKSIVESKTTQIKPLITDQTNMGGIGNIYANDALFKAKISPMRPGKSLSEKEIKSLYDSILSVLKKGLESNGASELSFVNILGQDGEYQNHTLVYGKKGKPCPNKCGGEIKFIKLAGRGSYYCPKCQK